MLRNQFQHTPFTLGNKHNIPLNHDIVFVTPSADFITTSDDFATPSADLIPDLIKTDDFVPSPEVFITTSMLLMTSILKLFQTPSDAILNSNSTSKKLCLVSYTLNNRILDKDLILVKSLSSSLLFVLTCNS